jgi:hypothetical protein
VPIVAIVPLIAGGSGFQTARDDFRSHADSMQVFFEIAGEDSRVKPDPPRLADLIRCGHPSRAVKHCMERVVSTPGI